MSSSSIALVTCAGLLTLTLSACGGSGSDSSGGGVNAGAGSKDTGGSSTTYSVGGSISGLGNATGLFLANGSDTVSVVANATTFTLPTMLATGATYSVTVKTQPTGETCTVANGSGTMATANVTNINVTCVVNHYTVGGSIAGLTATGLVLANNGADATTISANATQFNMATSVASGSAYAISVQTQPAGENCTVSNATGTVGSANVTTVAVNCTASSPVVESVLYSFGGSATDGKTPVASLIQATDGNFYGTTTAGGAHSAGTVFSITPGGTESILYSFTDGLADGSDPAAAPMQARDGNFYGTTAGGGSHAAGVLYKLTPAGSETVLWTFADGADGGDSTADLIQGTDGSLYGTGAGGGLHYTGVLFNMTLGGTESVVYSFSGASNAGRPSDGVIQGSDGNFYGTTPGGGPSNNGVVYSVTPSGTETILYTFTGGADGGTPHGRLVQASDGNFYGTTEYGGAHGSGVVFKVTPSGTATVVYSFANGADGSAPVAGLIQASDGNFYGTTIGGSHYNNGTVFQVTPSGTETVIYAFQGGTDGSHPVAALVQGKDGNLYGTTRDGGANAAGTVFKVLLP